MGPLVFLGGALTGAAGLLAAALWDQSRIEAQFSPLLKSASSLDAGQAAGQLNSYFFKAQEMYARLNEIMLESCELIATPISPPDESIFEKVGASLGGRATLWLRGWRESQLNDLARELEQLFDRYRGVFERANELVPRADAEPVDLRALKLSGTDVVINRSLDNDDWDLELAQLAAPIEDFIQKSCDAAERLIDALETSPRPALESASGTV